MDTLASLEGRVASLERSLRRSRRTAAVLGAGALVVAVAAFAPRAQQAQTPEQVVTQRLAFTNELGVEQVALMAGTDGSLIVQDAQGAVIMRIGGDPARRIRH